MTPGAAKRTDGKVTKSKLKQKEIIAQCIRLNVERIERTSREEICRSGEQSRAKSSNTRGVCFKDESSRPTDILGRRSSWAIWRYDLPAGGVSRKPNFGWALRF